MLRKIKTKIRRRFLQGGFTMIEMAVVLVIIGMILAAVMAGKDVVSSSKTKNFVQWVRGWEDAIMQYRSSKGYFPGDGNGSLITTSTTAGGALVLDFKDTTNGVIGDEDTHSNSATFLVKAFVAGAHEDHVIVEGQDLFIKIGNDNGAGADDGKSSTLASPVQVSDPDRNVIVICGNISCTKAISAEALLYLEALDAAVDGVAMANKGRVRTITAVTPLVACSVTAVDYPAVTTALLNDMGRDTAAAFTKNETAACINEVTENDGALAVSTGGTASGYTTTGTGSGTILGIVFYFDHVRGTGTGTGTGTGS